MVGGCTLYPGLRRRVYPQAQRSPQNEVDEERRKVGVQSDSTRNQYPRNWPAGRSRRSLMDLEHEIMQRIVVSSTKDSWFRKPDLSSQVSGTGVRVPDQVQVINPARSTSIYGACGAEGRIDTREGLHGRRDTANGGLSSCECVAFGQPICHSHGNP